jgi:hypothetical protein
MLSSTLIVRLAAGSTFTVDASEASKRTMFVPPVLPTFLISTPASTSFGQSPSAAAVNAASKAA